MDHRGKFYGIDASCYRYFDTKISHPQLCYNYHCHINRKHSNLLSTGECRNSSFRQYHFQYDLDIGR